jgi:hypothetical protein
VAEVKHVVCDVDLAIALDHLSLAMTVGYPVSWPEPRPRKALEEVVRHEAFS